MKQNINEIKKMQRLAGLITESEYQEALMNEAITLDPIKLKALVIALSRHGGSRGDREDYKEIAKLLASNQPEKAAEAIYYLDTSPNEMVYDMIKSTYPELWDILFDNEEGDYIALATPKHLPKQSPSTSDMDDDNKLGFSSDVKAYIDDAVKSAKEDGEFEELKKVGFFDTELIDNILEEFDEEGEYDGVNQAVKDYIAKVTK